MDWPISGVDDDEIVHLEKFENEGILLNSSNYVILAVECYDTEAYATVSETATYTKNGIEEVEQVVHELTVIYDDNGTYVLSDRYAELFSGFESCSYVPPMVENSVNAEANAGGSPLCIIQIALGEVGYTETGNNITKYATELETNQTAWCSIFIRWCAYKANISEDIIPLKPVCVDLRAYYTREGLYHTKDSGYTPVPGDIFFKCSSDGQNHVGIVEKVEGEYIWIIDGNASDMVKHRTMNMNSSEILGYANPNYDTVGHTESDVGIDNGANHSILCANCSAVVRNAAHVYTYTEISDAQHQEVCTYCLHVGQARPHMVELTFRSDSTHHWHECGDCGYRENEQAHTCGAYYASSIGHWKICSVCEEKCYEAEHLYLVDADGTRICRICGYEGPGSVIMKKIGVIL